MHHVALRRSSSSYVTRRALCQYPDRCILSVVRYALRRSIVLYLLRVAPRHSTSLYVTLHHSTSLYVPPRFSASLCVIPRCSVLLQIIRIALCDSRCTMLLCASFGDSLVLFALPVHSMALLCILGALLAPCHSPVFLVFC